MVSNQYVLRHHVTTFDSCQLTMTLTSNFKDEPLVMVQLYYFQGFWAWRTDGRTASHLTTLIIIDGRVAKFCKVCRPARRLL